tara:strand:+ start:521 stop:802 length:282 start_codon:yes stop_codon:yes gene_type:complete
MSNCCAKKNAKIRALKVLNTYITFVMVGLADSAKYTCLDAQNNAKQAFADDDPAYIVAIAFARYLEVRGDYSSAAAELEDKIYRELKRYHNND